MTLYFGSQPTDLCGIEDCSQKCSGRCAKQEQPDSKPCVHGRTIFGMMSLMGQDFLHNLSLLRKPNMGRRDWRLDGLRESWLGITTSGNRTSLGGLAAQHVTIRLFREPGDWSM
jgi:hypothetical protein